MLRGVDLKPSILKKFGDNARSLRLSLDLSQERLAERAGLDSTYISGIERGVRNPSLTAIVQLAKGLGHSPAALFEGFAP